MNSKLKNLKKVLKPNKRLKHSGSHTPVLDAPLPSKKKLLYRKIKPSVTPIEEVSNKDKNTLSETLIKLKIGLKKNVSKPTKIKKVPTPVPNAAKFSITQVNSSTKLHPVSLKNKAKIKLRKPIKEVISEESMVKIKKKPQIAVKKKAVKLTKGHKIYSESTVKATDTLLQSVMNGYSMNSKNLSSTFSRKPLDKSLKRALKAKIVK